DQHEEVAGRTFEEVRAQTKADWNRTLGAVAVKASKKADPDSTLTKQFYTHLYRMYALPVNATSTSGTYRGVDGAVHKANGFTYYDGWSTWDDFRKYSVAAYIDPATYRDMVQSAVILFADAHAAGKSLGSLTHSVPTVRWERSAVVIADALSKGFKDFDRLDEAYPALKSYTGYYTGTQLRQGYIAGDPGTTVQRGYDQWALSVVADALGEDAEAKKLREQATMATDNLVRPGAWTAADGTAVGLLTPRDGEGDWQGVDYEKFEESRLYQGTLWQYHWYDAYDMGGLIEAMGGEQAGRAAIRHMFGEDSDADDGSTMLHSNANEIDLQAPYLFNYVGEPSLTQTWVRAIYTG
ncbi:glycoside hydrolase domain-containing protein, partial [Streptomyces venezuelae]|uniref:glycoside hydrolase domain-containing protein n=1 Tax=Streptomyces venezuelae TaxID=54571 RepID=UPI00364EA678